jgi:hypothetical protein
VRKLKVGWFVLRIAMMEGTRRLVFVVGVAIEMNDLGQRYGIDN